MKIRVYYDDTDAGGIVYHANYLKFCERARSELFFQRGMSPTQNNAHFVVKHIEADFIRSAKLGDMLEVKHKILDLKNASLTLIQSVWLDDIKLFEMTSILAYVKEGRPIRIDPKSKEFFLSIF
ncbi:YbgC/FadM family acyl-CoA thioesterase [Sulfurospirillum arcachonense]|uniref:YbgC/FadM family acyl-CoA thioesterase n=1 Tax=Sulfurospirillum arcachonense TaxID=57666 RepID=UPI000469B280|nr:YbgC/FadM family acyl-CoA thioesterase [Sulfurospirillum arcachonense]